MPYTLERATRWASGLRGAFAIAVTSFAVLAWDPTGVIAQEIRSPFGDGGDMGFPTRPAAAKRGPAAVLPPGDGQFSASRPVSGSASPDRVDPSPAAAGPIERTELAPLVGHEPDTAIQPAPRPSDTSAEAARMEKLLTGLDLPPRSPALADLLHRQMTSQPPAGAALAVRIEALYRAGALDEAARLLPASDADAVHQVQAARIRIAQGQRETGCESVRQASGNIQQIPRPMHAEVVLMQGYCAAAAGNPSGAGLFAALARETGAIRTATMAILESVATGTPPAFDDSGRLTALDYRLLRLIEGTDAAAIIPRVEPAMLSALAGEDSVPPAIRVRAAESAAASAAIAPAKLAEAWREAPAPTSAENIDPALRRANLFRAAEGERTPARKARLLRTLLDDLRRNGPYMPALPLLAPAVENLPPVAEIGWFAETAVEILLGGSRFNRARGWIAFAGTLDPRHDLSHWLALIDIAEASTAVRRGESLGSIEDLALRGRFGPDALHRLSLVLDALDYNVPMRLWEAASRTPQPTQGHLPETGVLAELQTASRQRDGLATVALSIRSIGPATADQANLLTLGDTIRALRRAGFEAEARRLAIEALLPLWPRSASN